MNASKSLDEHAQELLTRLLDSIPPDENPTPLTASVHDVSGSTMTAELVWDNSGTGNGVTLDWGVTDVTDDEEPATGSKTYQYELEGDYTIVVTDLDDNTRTVNVDVTVPFVTGA
jgi:hypothetical protein